MSLSELSQSEFQQSWRACPDHRYTYELNNGALLLFAVLLGGFWAYWGVTVGAGGLDMFLGVLGGGFLGVSLYVGHTILTWRHFGRNSGVVCETDRLVWRQGDEIFAANWRELNLDTIGLLNVDSGKKKYEHSLTIFGKNLYIFRPFVRMRKYEIFLADVLIRLKKHDRIPKKRRKKGKKR